MARASDTSSAPPARPLGAIVAASSGNLVEWFDFYVYAFCSLYFAEAFFPGDDPTSQLLSTAGVFAAGFWMRPVGGWIFGRLADRHGRRHTMLVTLLMMCAGSLVIALLPTHASIGVWAPALLLGARLLQGLSLGGEYGAAATYMSEAATAERRGFWASFHFVTLLGGQLLALLVVVSLQTLLSDTDLRDWGWRLPFFAGALAALISLWLRRTLPETAPADAQRQPDAGALRALLRHKIAFASVVGYTAGGSLAFYTFTTYMQKYLVSAGMPARTASAVMTVAIFVAMLLQPLGGALSDRIGRRNQMLAFGACSALGTWPLMVALRHTPSSPWLAGGLVTLGLAGVSLYTSIAGVIKAEVFPTEVRALGVGLSYGLANAIFGGSAEYVALKLKAVGCEEAFFGYVTVAAALGMVASWRIPARGHGMLEPRETGECASRRRSACA
ncbi:MAG TPA: MFS family transporter [Myxococcota bacterium]|nr:MFS family transporter [Myxococcota bacterium]